MCFIFFWYGLVMRNPVLKFKSMISSNYKLQMIIKKCVPIFLTYFQFYLMMKKKNKINIYKCL